VSAAPHENRAHAKLSPSAAHRWMECPGSIAACAGIPSTSSVFADEGTAAHTLCETCLRDNLDADAMIGSMIPVGDSEYPVTEEMAESVQAYLDYVRPLYEGAEVEIEAKLDLSYIPGMAFGTGDFCAFNPGSGALDIVDFKYGRGVKVHAKDNPQLLVYALGVAKRFHNRGVKKVRLTIIQPRVQGPVDLPYELDAVALLDFEADLIEAAARTMKPDAPRKAGEWCKFCPAAPGCKAFADAALAVASEAFADYSTEPVLDDVAQLDADELAAALRRVGVLKSWLKRMEEHAHAEAMAGRLPTGFKLVPKRATRKWLNAETPPAELMDLLGADALYSAPKLKSPAEVEPLMPGKNKAARAAALADFTEKVSSGTNLVPDEDPRAPARPKAEDVFL
jgi:hypothetical protein